MESPHPCLLILEIITLICDALFSDGPLSRGFDSGKVYHLRSLAAMAATCKAFSIPANRLLWSEMESPSPLFQCLPKDLWRLVENGTGLSRIVFCRDVLSSDVNAFLVKSRLVKKLNTSSYGKYYVCGSTIPVETDVPLKAWQDLDAASQNLKLFPNLTFLSSWSGEKSTIIYRHIGPCLSTLLVGSGAENHAILASLPERHPGLYRLEISDNRNPPSSLQGICGLHNLRHFMTYCELAAVLNHLMGLPHLESLICHSFFHSLQIPPSLPDQRVFQALRSLRLSNCADVMRIIELLGLLQNAQLNQFEVRMFQRVTDEDWKLLSNSLITTLSHSSLKELDLRNIMRERRGLPLPIDCIRPLFAFKYLHKLVLCVDEGISMEDIDVEEFIEAFPCLEELDLRYKSRIREVSRLTLASISRIAERCPHMKSIHMTIDATKLDGISCPKVANDSGVKLYFGDSPMKDDDVPLVASLLRRMFSNMILVEGYHEEWVDVRPGLRIVAYPWSKVAKLLYYEGRLKRLVN